MTRHNRPHPNHPGANQSQAIVPNQGVALAVFKAEGFSGPLPPPQMLVKYNEAFEGCAERIVAMAERQATHRQGIEKTAVESNFRSERRGQILGFVIALAAICGGFYLAMHDKETAGLATIIATVVSLSGVFIYGKWQQKKQLDQKNPQIKS